MHSTAVRRHFLVMADLDGAGPLRAAYHKLRTSEFGPDQLSVLGTSHVMNRLRSTARLGADSDRGFEELVKAVEPLPFGTGTPVLITAGSLLTKLKQDPPRTDGGDPSGCWLPPEHRAEMLRRLGEGSVWLLADAGSQQQLKVANRALLEISKHPVWSLVR